MRAVKRIACLLAVLPWIGCLGKAPLRPPVARLPVPAAPTHESLTHLLGRWELPGKDGKMKLLIFDANGQLRFEGGLEYYNPARWQLDENRQELVITLPNAPNEKLDIFKMYVGDGVQAFDRNQKQVTFHFTPQIWELNMAGWTYHKPDAAAPPPIPEPVFK